MSTATKIDLAPQYALSIGYALSAARYDIRAAREEIVGETEQRAAKFIEVAEIDGTSFCVFKIGRRFYFQLRCNCQRATWEHCRLETIAQCCQFIELGAWSVGYHKMASLDRGRVAYTFHVDAMADNYATDKRVCLRVSMYAHTTYIEVQELSGYDSKEHCWREEGARYKIAIDGKRGRKPLLDLVEAIYKNAGGCLEPRNVSLMRDADLKNAFRIV